MRQCAVFGVPDPEWGDVVVAAVAGDALDERGLRVWAGARLTPPEIPRAWLLMDELPQLDTGKVDLDALRERFGR